MLYKLLKPVSQDVAVLMVVLALIGNPIAMLTSGARFVLRWRTATLDPGRRRAASAACGTRSWSKRMIDLYKS
jgi:hypothetical protein